VYQAVALSFLEPIRDTVISGASNGPGSVVGDAGCGDALSVLDPAEAEGMTGRIRIDLKVVGFLGFGCRLEQLCTPRHRFFVSCIDVVDPKVEVDLLRVPMRPLGRDVVRRELDPNTRLTVDEHHVPVVLSVHCATEEPGPKAALGGQIRGVEDDDLMVDSHRVILARSPAADQRGITGAFVSVSFRVAATIRSLERGRVAFSRQVPGW
jgi:hypothetical protein